MESIATALYALDILILVTFQVMNRDYGPFSHAVSDYGLGRTARLFQVYVLAGTVAAPLLAWQFWAAHEPAYSVAVPVYLVLVAVGRLAIGLFPNDPRGIPHTRAGLIHRTATLLAFCCAFMAVVEATPLLAAGASGVLPPLLAGVRVAISIGFVAVILTISAPLRRYFGLAERGFLYATALWFLIATRALPPL